MSSVHARPIAKETPLASRIRLTHPPTHTNDEIDLLFRLYELEHPDTFASWIDIERDYRDSRENPLTDIQRHGIQFLMRNTDWESLRSLTDAWYEIRKKVIARAMSN